MRRPLLAVAVLALALALPSHASAHTPRSCGTIPVARFPHPSKVLVSYGPVSCAEARKVLTALEAGHGRRTSEGPESDGPIEVDHWHCGQGAGGAWCGKGEAANRGYRKYIQLIYGESHPVYAAAASARSRARHPYLTMARAERAIIRSEVQYWRSTSSHVQLQVGDCERRSRTAVRCVVNTGGVFTTVEGQPGPFQWISGEDEARLAHAHLTVRVID
jgi:hypothetical protein